MTLGCDGVIQLTANATDDSECNLPCSGDDTLLCGGSSRIMVFTDGTPGPKIPTLALIPTVGDGYANALWQYVGCYRYVLICLYYDLILTLCAVMARIAPWSAWAPRRMSIAAGPSSARASSRTAPSRFSTRKIRSTSRQICLLEASSGASAVSLPLVGFHLHSAD